MVAAAAGEDDLLPMPQMPESAAAPTGSRNPRVAPGENRGCVAPRSGRGPVSADRPADLLDRVLYRDGLVLVIDKPAGLPVHAGPGGGPNLEHWFPLLRFGLPKPPALAHRLDRDTSGCLVLGRHPKALRRLGKLFAEGRVEKIYWAVVSGVPREEEGRIEAPLLKQARGRIGWRMVVDPAGQKAVTDYRVLGMTDGMAWLELRPRTGRTHQIRVHCAVLGCPVVGDPAYGGPDDRPLQLHARAISLPLYPEKPPVAVAAPVPPHMRELLTALGWREDGDAPAGSAAA
jgi:tRNA pseudouridine32 synthase/23S rRNA pseudouridine746 synthase/23S rRNA pseudouridine1911/1915/1917 synthase